MFYSDVIFFLVSNVAPIFSVRDIGTHFFLSMPTVFSTSNLLSSPHHTDRTRKDEYYDFPIHWRHFDFYYCWVIMDYVEFKLLYDALIQRFSHFVRYKSPLPRSKHGERARGKHIYLNPHPPLRVDLSCQRER